ncbi:MAG: hypothetical protein ACI9WU_002163 [Myxococcota bacterium]
MRCLSPFVAFTALLTLASACGTAPVRSNTGSSTTGDPDQSEVVEADDVDQGSGGATDGDDAVEPADGATGDGGETVETPDPGPGGPDLGPPVGQGGVGDACFKDDQCNSDGLCLDWLDGYCTMLNCPIVFDCPEGAGCVDLGEGTTICLDLCESESECRPGYGCKPFVSVGGEVLSGCVGLTETASPAGGTCKEHSGCADSLACLTFVPEGYCALIGCEVGSCPDDTACVTYNGQSTCLATCQEDENCLIGNAKDRSCSPLLNLNNEVALVCIPSVDGEGVGSQCTLDIECSTNECVIVAEGKCVASNLGCFVDKDCGGAGICELAPAYVKGVCTQVCTPELGCPGQSFCIDSPSGPAFCQVPCTGLNDLTSCDTSVGESCVFGDPVASTGSGSYACVAIKKGDPGMDCNEDDVCKAPPCLFGTEDQAGTCAGDCSETLNCPFPAACVEHDGALRCMKRCFSIQDCPGTLSCKATPTSFSKICLP